MKIEIVEDTLTKWISSSDNYFSEDRVKAVLQSMLENVYAIVEDSVPVETGYLRQSGQEDYHFVDSGTAMGINMIFSGHKNPKENREEYGHTDPPIYPDQPYALHQYIDKNRPWFHQNWAEIEEVIEDIAIMEYDAVLGTWVVG